MINKHLMYSEWKREVLEPHMLSKSNTEYSEIFCIGTTSDYDVKKKTVMIVGQEANNYGSFGKCSLEELIAWPQEYMDRQLLGILNGNIYNGSPFWMMSRKYYNLGFNVVWNNLDKVHKIVNGTTVALSEVEEMNLNVPFGKENKTLLLQEIDLIKPDIIVFATGPNYSLSMASSLGINRDDLLKNFRPSRDGFIREISDIAKLASQVFWTYHPKYLNTNHSIDEAVKLSLIP